MYRMYVTMLGLLGSMIFLTGAALADGAKAEVADKSKVPYKYAGKLLILRTPAKFDEICSAQYAGSEDVVLTAAHCLYENGVEISKSKLLFLHGFDANTTIEASSPAELVDCIAVPKDYGSKDPSYDFAFLKMKAKGDKGFFKLGSGITEGEAVTAIGYPSNFKDGKELMATHGTRGKFKTLTYKSEVQRMLENPFDDGSSGGAWINSKREVVGVNAKFLGTPKGSAADDNQMVSPLLEGKFKTLFDFANGGCQGENP